MFKKVLLLLSLVSVSLLGAQSSRVNALSGLDSSSGYYSPTANGRVSIYDTSDVVIFPHLANQYSDVASVYYAGANNYNAFGTFNIMSGLTLGVTDYNATQEMFGIRGVTDTDGNPISLASHTYSLFAAYGLGSMNFGLSFDYWSSHFKHEVKTLDTTTNQNNIASKTVDSHIASIKASFGMDLGNNMGFDSLLQFDFGNYTNEVYDSTGNPKTVLLNSPDAYTAISAGGRFFMDLSYSVKMTAWGFLDYKNEGYKDLTYNAEHKRVDTVGYTSDNLQMNLGASFEIEAIKDKLVMTPMFGIMIVSTEVKTEILNGQTKGSIAKENSDTYAIPYLGFSLEYNIRKWLTIYSGYTKFTNSQSNSEYQLGYANDVKQAEETKTDEKDNVNSNFALGISFQNDDFKFIATLNKDLIINGPNFISGTNTPMFLNATLQYKFGTPEQKFTPKPQIAPKTEKISETPKVKSDETAETETETPAEDTADNNTEE